MAKRRLLAVQLADPPEYPSVLHGIATYRDGLLYVCSHLLSTGLYDIDLCECCWGDSPMRYNLSEYDAVLVSALGHQVVGQREQLTCMRRLLAGKVPIIIGGPHATFAPYDALRYADFAVLGPGEIAAQRLLATIFDEPDASLRKLPPGVAAMSASGELMIRRPSGEPPPMIPLAPVLYRKAPPLHWAVVNFSRGCPYNCSFCYGVRIHGHRLLKKEPRMIRQELDGIFEATGCRNFYVSDLCFGLDKKYTAEIIDTVRGAGYTFVVLCRLELGDDRVLVEELKAAGFSDFLFGVESLDDRVLTSYRKKIDAGRQADRIRAFSSRGLAIHGSFVFGADGQNYGDVLAAGDWAARNELSYVCFALYTDYPYQQPLYGVQQMFPDWRMMQFSPAYQHYSYVSVFPTCMRPSKLQRTVIQAYRNFIEGRLASNEQSGRMTRIRMWARNMKYTLACMERYAQYLEAVEMPYYNRSDELLDTRLRDEYYARVGGDPTAFERQSIVTLS